MAAEEEQAGSDGEEEVGKSVLVEVGEGGGEEQAGVMTGEGLFGADVGRGAAEEQVTGDEEDFG